MNLIEDTFNWQEFDELPERSKVIPASNLADEVIDLFYGTKEAKGAYLPWEKAADKLRIRKREVTLYAGINGHGKALSLDTPILTRSGWSTMGALRVGDVVFDQNGAPCNVVAATDVMHDRPCYDVVFSDGSKVTADAAHEWLTKTQLCLRSERNARRLRRKGEAFLKYAVDQSHKRTFPAIVTTQQIAETLHHRTKQGVISNHAIPTCGAVDFPAADLPIDPYVFGAWLGDGSKDSGMIHGADDEIFESVEAVGYETRRWPARFRCGVYGLTTQLRAAGVLGAKVMPAAYMTASIPQRLALLQGLMDTDGTVTPYGRCAFTNTNFALAEAVRDLVVSLGIIAKIIPGRATLYGKDCGPVWDVTFTTAEPVFRLRRKLARLQASVSTRSTHRFIVACLPVPSVPVRCIQVDSPSHLYLAGRNLIPTHNSLVTSQIALGLMRQGEPTLLCSFEMRPSASMQRMTRQAAVTGEPSIPYIRAFHKWTDSRLWIYDHFGTCQPQKALAVCQYAAREFGVRQFVVDSLMKCVAGTDDYTGQKLFVADLGTLAAAFDGHVHLVAHARKGQHEGDTLDKFDIKGAGEISDQVDNVVIVQRNKRKESLRERGEKIEDDAPDVFFTVCKQRHSTWEGTLGLWFDAPSGCFVERPQGHAKPLNLQLPQREPGED